MIWGLYCIAVVYAQALEPGTDEGKDHLVLFFILS